MIKIGMKLTVFTSVVHRGTVTKVERNGFWIIEQNKIENFILFTDIEELSGLKN